MSSVTLLAPPAESDTPTKPPAGDLGTHSVRGQGSIEPGLAFPALVPILLMLRELLVSSDPVTIQPAEFVDLLGAADLTQNLIYLDVSQSWDEWCETFVHELLHLHRGPFDPAVEEAEEQLVEAATRHVMRGMLVELRAAMGAQR